jgi:hypothetical protein
LSACGNTQQENPEISTAVAQTVQAQNSLTEVAALPSPTPAPALGLEITRQSLPTSTNTPAAVSNPGCTLSAILVSENPPDDTIYLPGDNFWKTWNLQNTGTCIWDSSYKLVFWNGDLMGGLSSYPLPETIAPSESKDISIYLKAPETEGTFTGYWQLQSPWGTNFGVGAQSLPFYVKVGTSADPEYGITDVTYTLTRDPQTGCPFNVWYTVSAAVTASGPYEFSFRWLQSDGNESGIKGSEFTEAGSKTFEREWKISMDDNNVQRWVQFVVTEPAYKEYDKVIIDHSACLK